MQAIARDLGRSPGSISREIKRNSHPVLGYQPYGAHRAATDLHADLGMKERAMARIAPLGSNGPRFIPKDHMLMFLEALKLCRSIRHQHDADQQFQGNIGITRTSK